MGLIKNIASAFRATREVQPEPVKNDYSLAEEFLRRGNVKAASTIIQDQKFDPESTIKGYLYAALELRANSFADFCADNVVSTNKLGLDEEHPYLKLIEESQVEDEYEFWRDLIVDYDMFGEAFIFILRRVVYSEDRNNGGHKRKVEHLGRAVAIEQLDASQMTVLRNSYGEVVGYRQRIDSKHKREFLPEQIIHIYRRHPLKADKVYSIYDAVKDYQHIINKGSEYAQAALVNNTNTPGIVSTPEVLTDEEYNNLIARVNSHEAGKVIITDGTSQLNYTPISQNLDSAALPELNEINRQTIFAVTGTSKTMLGIEESGTTRETARVQEAKFQKRTIIPLVRVFLSKLNFDYRVSYKAEFSSKGMELKIRDISNPAEAQEEYTTRKTLFDNIMEIVYSGYTIDSAQAFMNGEIQFNEMEMDSGDAEAISEEQSSISGDLPAGPEQPNPTTPTGPTPPAGSDEQPDVPNTNELSEQELTQVDIENQTDYEHSVTNSDDFVNKALMLHTNAEGELDEYGSTVRNKIIKAKDDLLKQVRAIQLNAIKQTNTRLAKNAFDYRDIRTNEQEEETANSLFDVIRRYWLLIIPLIGRERVAEDNQQLGTQTSVNLLGERDVQDFVKQISRREADSHTRTIYSDILDAANKGYNKVLGDTFATEYLRNWENGDDWFKTKPSKTQIRNKLKNPQFVQANQELYDRVSKMIDDGYQRETIERTIRNEYVNMSRKRATTLVGNEMAKAITSSQFLADYSLLRENNMLSRAYKRLVSNSGNPCPFCQKIIDQGDIPFTDNFVNLGENLQVQVNGKTQVMQFNYEPIRDGILHVNCRCSYQLVIH